MMLMYCKLFSFLFVIISNPPAVWCQDEEDNQAAFDSFIPELETSYNCDELFMQGVTNSGEYYIRAQGYLRKVYCQVSEPVTQQNWLIIQQRTGKEVGFARNWNNYTDGFGTIGKGFWIGLDKLYAIVSTHADKYRYLLRIELTDFNDRKVWAEYSSFRIEGPESNYVLHIGGYKGNAGDSMSYVNKYPFSTYDNDHDIWDGNCGLGRQAGWWFRRCTFANLNGRYIEGGHTRSHSGIYWYYWKKSPYSMKTVEMKIRPIPVETGTEDILMIN